MERSTLLVGAAVFAAGVLVGALLGRTGSVGADARPALERVGDVADASSAARPVVPSGVSVDVVAALDRLESQLEACLAALASGARQPLVATGSDGAPDLDAERRLLQEAIEALNAALEAGSPVAPRSPVPHLAAGEDAWVRFLDTHAAADPVASLEMLVDILAKAERSGDPTDVAIEHWALTVEDVIAVFGRPAGARSDLSDGRSAVWYEFDPPLQLPAPHSMSVEYVGFEFLPSGRLSSIEYW